MENSFSNVDKNSLYCKYIEEIMQGKHTIKPGEDLLNNDNWTYKALGEQGNSCFLDNSVYRFYMTNPLMKTEFKFYVIYMIATEVWHPYSVASAYRRHMNLWTQFINNNYADKQSVLDIDEYKLITAWHSHLKTNYPSLVYRENFIPDKRGYMYHTPAYNFPEKMICALKQWLASQSGTDWECDIWNIRNLSKFGIRYVKSTDHVRIDFGYMCFQSFKPLLKRYLKENLLSGINFTWGTATAYFYVINQFIDFYNSRHPDVKNFNDLNREDFIGYFEMMSSKEYIKNYSRYLRYNARILKSFFTYIQIEEYPEAPSVRIEKLLKNQDLPHHSWGNDFDEEKCVPEYVLAQLEKNVDRLPDDSRLAVLIMLNTGLRISDTLELRYESLTQHENNYWIELPIIKSNIKHIQLPVTDQLADAIKERIGYVIRRYGERYNPDHYLFVSPRRTNGTPICSKKILLDLNKLAQTADIKDKDGKRYHFMNKGFRHSFAVTCLNNGMDIITLQDFLGHASPEVTQVYAKLLDTTKKEAFKAVMGASIFSFGKNDAMKREDLSDVDPEKIERFWLKFKVNAIDTPYGTCLQRTEGKCSFSVQPPCLTCRGGEPCKDLCIGAASMDVAKYDILIKSTQNMIALAKANDKQEMVEENLKLLNRYKGIKDKLDAGAIIYGRPERIADMKEEN